MRGGKLLTQHDVFGHHAACVKQILKKNARARALGALRIPCLLQAHVKKRMQSQRISLGHRNALNARAEADELHAVRIEMLAKRLRRRTVAARSHGKIKAGDERASLGEILESPLA